jgi:CRISPR-associated protein Csm2
MKEKFGDQDLKKWDATGILNVGEQLAKVMKDKKVTTSQIRKFIDELQRLRSSSRLDLEQVKLTKIRLIYAAGRAEKGSAEALKNFEQAFSYALEHLHDKQDFTNLVRFVETVVAYHRYLGGSDK